MDETRQSQLEEARTAARAVHRARQPAPEVLALMGDRKRQGAGLREIARRLNRLSIRPGGGRQWYASSVRNQIAGCCER